MNNISKKLVALFIIGGCILGVIFNPYLGLSPIPEAMQLNISMIISKVIQIGVVGAIFISIVKNWLGLFWDKK